jgi:hypothetical protein
VRGALLSPEHLQIRELAAWDFDHPVDRGSLDLEQLHRAACHTQNKHEQREPYRALSAIHAEVPNEIAKLLANRNQVVADSGEFDGLAWNLAIVDLRKLIAFQRRIGFASEARLRIVDWQSWGELLDLALPTHAATSSPYIEVASYEGRWFLRDGYHRSFLLLKRGINLVPAVVVYAETLGQLGAVGRQFFAEGTIMSGRPPMVTDFHDDDIAVRYIRTLHNREEQALHEPMQKAGPQWSRA